MATGFDGIRISLNEVTRTAGTIRSLNGELDARLQDIRNEMKALEQVWQSDASTTIRQRFESLAPRFEDYKNVVNSYATFLDGAVQQYEGTEQSINSNASAFQ